MLGVIIYTTLSGLVGTSLGGLIGVIIGGKDIKSINGVLGFACGIMMAIVFFDMLPESLEYGDTWLMIMGLILGIVVVYLINMFVENGLNAGAKINVVTTLFNHNNKSYASKSMFKAGIVMFLSISIHNLPEGLAVGTLGSVDAKLGLLLAVVIALHDIPEGMAISLPLVAGGMSKVKAFFLATVSGAVTVIGGVLGLLLGGINTSITSFVLAFAGGAMLSVCFNEIIPEIVITNKKALPLFFCLLGIVVGVSVIVIM